MIDETIDSFQYLFWLRSVDRVQQERGEEDRRHSSSEEDTVCRIE